MKIGKRLKELRKQKGISQRFVAEKTQLSQSYLSKIETDKADNPTITIVKLYADAIGVSMSTVFAEVAAPIDDPEVKVSICQKCKHPVRVAVLKSMDNKSKKEFAIEAIDHDLSIQTMPLSIYKKTYNNICSCN